MGGISSSSVAVGPVPNDQIHCAFSQIALAIALAVWTMTLPTVAKEADRAIAPLPGTIAPKEVGFLTMTSPLSEGHIRNYAFDGSISKEVLSNYLSRAITMLGLGDPGNPDPRRHPLYRQYGRQVIGRGRLCLERPGRRRSAFPGSGARRQACA